MGDTLWGTPAIRAAKKTFPNVGIDLLVQSQWMPLFKENKNIRHLVPYSPKWYQQLLVLPNLLKTHYDHVFIFHANKNISRILPWLRCSSIWSHQYPEHDKDGNLIACLPGIPLDKIVRFEKPVHGILRRIAMVEKIHVPSDGTHMNIFLKDKDRADAFSFLK